MRPAHATLFFDLVLSSMLVVVVLLSMQKFNQAATSDGQGDRWSAPAFAAVGIFGFEYFCSPSDDGAADTARLPWVGHVPDMFGVQHVPLDSGAATIYCSTLQPVMFFAPASEHAFTYWICRASSEMPVAFTITMDPESGELSYGCESGITGEMNYPFELAKVRGLLIANTAQQPSTY